MVTKATNKGRGYLKAIAAALGMTADRQLTLPHHLPYVPYKANTGKRRTTKTRVNRAAWKCNERKPMSDKTRGHLNDIVQTFWGADGQERATVRCRRCGHPDVVDVKTKQYTQNKTVLLAREEARQAAA